jgi:hypothetical protein
MLERLAWAEDTDPYRIVSFSAAFCIGLSGGKVLLANEISRFSLIFAIKHQYAASCLTIRLNLAFRVAPLFSYAQPGDDSVGFSSNAVQTLACSHIQGP